MDGQPIHHLVQSKPPPDGRKQLGLCLREAFPVGEAGSFTSLIGAIGDDRGRARR